MKADTWYPRLALDPLIAALGDSPAVLIHGPRQCGKSTLAVMAGEARGYDYFSFDDDVIRLAAEEDPAGFVMGLPEKVIMDEVQRVPQLFVALKSAIDRDRRPGRFILTGSSNVLLLPDLADSLAGRMEIVRLHPLAQCELQRGSATFIDRLFSAEFHTSQQERLGDELLQRIVAGGYPSALTRPTEARRATWYRDYVEALVQRDVRDMSRIRSLDVLPRLMTLAAGQTARLINVSDLSAPFQLSRQTIADYVTILRQVFLIDLLQPWHTNRLSRIVKTPKLHLVDTGVAAALLGLHATDIKEDRVALGQFLESFVFQDLQRQSTSHTRPISFYHYRDRDGAEVDIVLERGASRIAGIEVKSGATVTAADFRGMRKLRDAAGARFTCGVVVYDGEFTVPFGDRLYAVPLATVFA